MHKPVESALSPFGTGRAHSLARSFFAQKAFYWYTKLYAGFVVQTDHSGISALQSASICNVRLKL